MRKDNTNQLISEIRERLNRIEGHMVWMITADSRLRVGQRVEFSRRAIRKSMVPKTRVHVRGIVKRIENTFAVRVLFDDRKHPNTYHHAFLNPVTGEKLF